jgi:hypothetical protein
MPADSLSVAAVGKAGAYTIEVLSRPDGGLLLSIASPGWCLDFALARPATVGELAAFLTAHAGREGFAELAVGSLGGLGVRMVKDCEFTDRFFLRAWGEGVLVEFTLAGLAAGEFIAAVVEAAAEFEAAAEPAPAPGGQSGRG